MIVAQRYEIDESRTNAEINRIILCKNVLRHCVENIGVANRSLNRKFVTLIGYRGFCLIVDK